MRGLPRSRSRAGADGLTATEELALVEGLQKRAGRDGCALRANANTGRGHIQGPRRIESHAGRVAARRNRRSRDAALGNGSQFSIAERDDATRQRGLGRGDTSRSRGEDEASRDGRRGQHTSDRGTVGSITTGGGWRETGAGWYLEKNARESDAHASIA